MVQRERTLETKRLFGLRSLSWQQIGPKGKLGWAKMLICDCEFELILETKLGLSAGRY